MLSDDLIHISSEERDAQIVLQNQLVPLLSEQLYRSPIKAIEELVVNSYDADATACRIFVPTPADLAVADGDNHFIIVFDDGEGMRTDQLVTLWEVGLSPKTLTRKIKERKQIGKFGIGKLATYAVAHRLTYITRTSKGLLTSALNFRDLDGELGKSNGRDSRASTSIRRIAKFADLASNDVFKAGCKAAHVKIDSLNTGTWTLAILEDLKPKAKTIQQGRLKWVLATAMPLKTDFRLFLAGEEIKSSKQGFKPVVEINIGDLPKERIASLNESSGQNWKKKGKTLIADSFPQGIAGTAMMTEETLMGKSDDLERSHGFFIYVLGRLVNLDDALFGMSELSYKYFHRFRAEVHVDDLDDTVVAARDAVELSELRKQLVLLLREVFYESRQRFDQFSEKKEEDARGKNEDSREYVPHRLVEYPVADVISTPSEFREGADADKRWYYLAVPKDLNVKELAKKLYDSSRIGYQFKYSGAGSHSKLVQFNPELGLFTINKDHEFVRKHSEGDAENCLEDFVIAETMLEVYLREEGITAAATGEILQRRDALLRGLANDQLQSPAAIARLLRDSANNEHELEIGLVVAARSLGFIAKHLGAANKPDGLAVWNDHPRGARRITLEAKSSDKVPSLSAIDFGVLHSHMKDKAINASGCLLVAPDYPGLKKKEEFARASRVANEQKISCWMIEDLARVVEASQRRHINAEQIIEIVEKHFNPVDVHNAVEELLTTPEWDRSRLGAIVIAALRILDERLEDAPRTVEQLVGVIVGGEFSKEFAANFKQADIRTVVSELAAASHGSLRIDEDGNTVRVLTSIEEVERRCASYTKQHSTLRKPGKFRRKGQ
jgi:Histidine kinase-, DNA gyrase B-, and HSP90-like ATPase